MSREQKLVDICFEIALTVKSYNGFKDKTNQEMAGWVAKQLEVAGFPTEPCGSSWGVLIEEKSKIIKTYSEVPSYDWFEAIG